VPELARRIADAMAERSEGLFSWVPEVNGTA